MYLVHFKIHGENVNEVINALDAKWKALSDVSCINKDMKNIMMSDNKVYCTIFNDVLIMCREEYYTRAGSTLMITTLIKVLSSNEAHVEMISGGGSSEWGFEFGSESKEARKICLDILSLCKKNQWEITDFYPAELLEKTTSEKIINLKTKFLHLFNDDN